MAPEPSWRHVLTLDSGDAAVGEASIWVRTLAAQYAIPAKRCERLDLCVNELVGNVVEHAYRGGPGEIGLELTVSSRAVTLTVIDAGPAFDPLDLATPERPASLETASIGGLGVHLVRRFADACRYERRQGRNHFTACFGDGSIVSRDTDRRQAGRAVLPLTRGDGTIVSVDEREGVDRRSLEAIARCGLFRNVPWADIEAIVTECRIVDYPVGVTVLDPAADANRVLVVVEGSLRVRLDGPDADDVVVIPRGECVGEISVADGRPASAWVTTAEPCRLLVVDGPVFLQRLLAIPYIGRNLITLLAERMRRTNERIVARVRSAEQLQALQRELDFARRIQASMLPSAPLAAQTPDLDYHGFMRAARQVGGDFYDWVALGPRRFLFAIGDVCDKGMPAALFMVRALTLLRSAAASGGDGDGACLARWLAHLNDQLAESNEAQLFVSVFCAIVDLDAGTVHFANAGHNAPLLVSPGGGVERLDRPRGPVAGIVPDLAFGVGRADFHAGSSLLLYTDGVTEAEAADRAQFGEARMRAALAAPAVDAAGSVRRIVDAVDAFAGGHPQSDDVTLLLVRRR